MHRRLCYISFIKKILICLLCLFSLLPTAGAKIDANQLLGGLLQVISEPQQPTPAQTTQQKKEEPSFGEQLALIASAATEGFKEEGRKYARELGDIVTRQMGVCRAAVFVGTRDFSPSSLEFSGLKSRAPKDLSPRQIAIYIYKVPGSLLFPLAFSAGGA